MKNSLNWGAPALVEMWGFAAITTVGRWTMEVMLESNLLLFSVHKTYIIILLLEMYTKDFRLKQAEKRISKLKEKSFEIVQS